MPDNRESIRIELKEKELADLKRKLKTIEGNFEEGLQKELETTMLNIETKAKEECPVLTGRLRSSTTSEVKKSEDGLIGRVGGYTYYAPIVHIRNPYLLRAILAHQTEIEGIFGKAFKMAIEVVKE